MLCVDMERNVGIDVLRGIAAFGIVGCHLLLLPMSNAGRLLTSCCDMNVGVFAALSGYLMAVSLKGAWVDYICKRVFRVNGVRPHGNAMEPDPVKPERESREHFEG